MAYQVAIIGSFQKYYSEVLTIIKIFKQAGLYVSSPKESFISGRIEDFVIFESDKKDYSPAEIQMITLEKILNADAVYVYNPNGYVGKTTCYEIGFCLSRNKPIYFYDYPDDLPIPVLKNSQILKPEEFVDFISNDKPGFITDYSLCPEAQKAFCNMFDLNEDIKTIRSKKIVICGSMMFFEEMEKCQQKLKEWGIDAIIPKEENDTMILYNEKQFMEFKKRVSSAYLKKIRDKSTMGVLIYNAEKKGIANYIGANTLVELAMAFVWNRKIFLLNDIYLPLKDELQAWGCICLNGEISKIKEEFFKENTASERPKYHQTSLFD